MTDATDALDIRLFGPVQALVDDVPAALGGPHQKLVLAVLAATSPDVVSADALAEAVWGEEAGRRSMNTLQVYVANLRRAVDRPGYPSVILTVRPGYRFGWPAHCVDLHRAIADADEAQVARGSGDWTRALALTRRVRAAVRGRLTADVREADILLPLRERAEELRWQSVELEFEALLQLGRPEEVVGPVRAALAQQPLREALWGQHMVALYRLGRQADALDVYRDARRLLGELLGIDPGPELRALEGAILRQSASLDPPSEPGMRLSWCDRSGRVRVKAMDPHGPALIIGRDAGADVQLSGDAAMSRRHALLTYSGNRWWLEDLGSRNGTRLNAHQLETPAALTDGDLVGIASATLIYTERAAGEATVVPAQAVTALAPSSANE